MHIKFQLNSHNRVAVSGFKLKSSGGEPATITSVTAEILNSVKASLQGPISLAEESTGPAVWAGNFSNAQAALIEGDKHFMKIVVVADSLTLTEVQSFFPKDNWHTASQD